MTFDVPPIIKWANERFEADVIAAPDTEASQPSSPDDAPVTVYPVTVVTRKMGMKAYEPPCPHHVPCAWPCQPIAWRPSPDVPSVPNHVVHGATLTITPGNASLLTDVLGHTLERCDAEN